MTKHIMIGCGLHVFMMSLVGTRSRIWMKTKTHSRIKDKPQIWIEIGDLDLDGFLMRQLLR